MDLETLGFDRVVVTVDGEAQEMDAKTFMELPYKAKVHHLVRGQFEFYKGGEPVTPREAFKQMRRVMAG
ncbi:MAG: hypothetical protein H6712_20100 [Myxococcales bacterium]|nr:hypothetical protein [Myxococcales bacterium]MCB9716180.1 hypothetical protein [Myxococcales bacterium]